MKERPILFSTPMIQAILSGRKTMTRMVVKPQPAEDTEIHYMKNPPFDWEQIYKREWCPWKWDTEDGETISKHCPCGQPGDVLWVKETWRPKGHNFPTGLPYEYKATAEDDGVPVNEPWKSPRFMPKVAARIFLEITDVRVERLNDITAADAIAEGMRYTHEFPELWEKINGPGSWEANPWVWVISFKRIEQ